MSSYEDATITGPINGDPPAPGTETEEDWKARYNLTNQQLKQARADVAALEEKLEEELEERRQVLHIFDYLGRVASGDDQDHVVEDMPASDDDHQSALARSYDRRRSWNQVEFLKTGPVAAIAAQVRLLQAERDEARAELAAEADDIVDAEIQEYIPEWAEKVDIANLALVGANTTGEITLQQGGPWNAEKAMVVAATIYTVAELFLDEEGGVAAAFDHLVKRVQNT